jgi:aminopeptidase N/puromycin-sensitive aminopeptidase
MQWWDNIWLNEGFATWMENKPVEAMHPDWNINQDVVEGLSNTLNVDAQPTTHAIRATATTREEIEQMFDGISYGKGSDVLLMVENYLGAETFRKGVHAYLTAHEYGNATAEDFWNAQTKTSGKPVDKIMDSLIAQPGEPILSFGTPENGAVSVAQKRFFLSPSIKPDADEKWTLPVCFKTAAGRQCDVLTPEKTSLKAPAGSLFFANAGGKGYYRSAYPAKEYQELVAHVESSLRPTERISLIGDEWAQVRANKSTVGDYLNLVAAVKDDTDAPVLGTALSGFDTIYSRVASTVPERDALAKWLRDNFSPVYAQLGPATPNDSPNKREMRAQLFGVLGYYGKDPAVLKEAREIAEKYIDNPASVEPSLGQTALGIAARNGDAELFDKLQHVYETSKNPQVGEEALRLLAEFENPDLEERSLEYALTNKVRNQDAAIQFAIGLQIPATRERAWKFIQDHWDAVHAVLTPEMGNILVGSTGAFCTEDARDQVQQFFATHKVASAERAMKHSVESIDGCIELRRLQGPNLKQWIGQNGLEKGE